MPKRQIQAEQSASAHAAAVVVESGTASAHHVVLSAMVKMYTHIVYTGVGVRRLLRQLRERLLVLEVVGVPS